MTDDQLVRYRNPIVVHHPRTGSDEIVSLSGYSHRMIGGGPPCGHCHDLAVVVAHELVDQSRSDWLVTWRCPACGFEATHTDDVHAATKYRRAKPEWVRHWIAARAHEARL